MRKMYKVSFLLLLLSASAHLVSAQNSFFISINENDASLANSKRTITPVNYNTLKAEINQLKNFLWTLPSEKNLINKNTAPVLSLPMPDGSVARFHVWESSLMEPGLEAKFPEMKTFAGVGIDDPYASIRFDYNPYFGFHAQVLSAKGRVYIDPYARWDVDHYMSYYTRDNKKLSSFTCETIDDAPVSNIITAGPCRGTQLFTYRLALACTGEYAVAVCAPNAPTIPATAAAMLTTVNRVTGVYETEVSLRMVLIANNNSLIYLDGTTDPYTNNSGGAMLGQNQVNIDNLIGSANYDIGHVVSTGGGGVANLRVPCVNGAKARGVTGLSNPVGDNFDIDYVAHEMGHQWGGNHTFNSSTGSCNGNRNGSTAYEVGSGTTIQAYAGICGTDNTQPHSDPFFHTLSFDEISNYISTGNGNNCKVATNTGNTLPVITAMNNNGASIPINTPFTLTGAATDADNDPLTYCWEQWDLGPSTTWNGGNANTTSPLFKSRVPIVSGSRTFPDNAVILAGYPVNPAATMGGLKGETLPTVARDMKFRLTVRDIHPGTPPTGGVVTGGEGCQTGFTGTYVIHVINTTGPFAVTVPNGGESYPAGSTQTVTWNVVGTDQAPISVANVKISLSTDGGLTYPTVLAASTPNDGSETVTMTGSASTTARIKVEAAGNVFFDISNANFNITAPTGTFDFTPPAPASVTCGTVNSTGITLNTVSILGYVVPVNLTATGNPAGTTVSFVPNPVVPGNATVVNLTGLSTLVPGNYPVTVTGTSGAIVKTVVLTYTVNPGTGPAIGTAPVAKQVCVGLNTGFTVVSATGTGYQWQVSTNGGGAWINITNGGVYSGVTTTALTITGATIAMNAYQYRVIVNGQCGSTTSTPAVLTVDALPVVTASASSTSVCSGSNVTLTASGANTYTWNAGTIPATGSSVTANPLITTTYVVTGTSTGTGCINTAQVTVTATPKPTLVLTASPYTKILPLLSTTITATANSATTNNFVYTWSYSGPGPAQVFIGNKHTVSLNNLGVYTVTAADAANLTCLSLPAAITIADSVSTKLFVFPSPNNGTFTISYYSPGASSSNKTIQQITIYDSKGSRVLSQEYEVSQPYQLHKMDMRRNAGGIYYIVLREANGNTIKTGEVVIK